MAQTTSPDNIPSPDLSDQYALTQDMANMADATQNALIKRANSYIGTSSQRTAWTTAPVGTLWSDTDGGRAVWKKSTTGWEYVVPPATNGRVSVPSGPLAQIGTTGVYGANLTYVVPVVAPAGSVLRMSCLTIGGGWSTYTTVTLEPGASSTTVKGVYMQVGGTAQRTLDILWEVIPVN